MTEAEKIEAALDALLSALIAHAEENPRGDSDVNTFLSLAARLDLAPGSTPAQRFAADLIEDPVGAALRRAIQTLGERLHEIGGLPLVAAVADRLEAQDPHWGHLRASTLGGEWAGIGRRS